MAKQIKPSARGELEITDLNRMYLEADDLNVQIMGRGFAWLDTGTMDSLIDASNFIQITETRQSLMISVPEEIAFVNKWITKEELIIAAEKYGKSPYGEYLKKVAQERYRY